MHCVWLQARRLGCPQASVTRNSYGADCRGVAEDGVAFCQEHGLEECTSTVIRSPTNRRAPCSTRALLRCYTINNMNDAERLVALGVSIIMTDFPDDFWQIESSVGQGAQIKARILGYGFEPVGAPYLARHGTNGHRSTFKAGLAINHRRYHHIVSRHYKNGKL